MAGVGVVGVLVGGWTANWSSGQLAVAHEGTPESLKLAQTVLRESAARPFDPNGQETICCAAPGGASCQEER